MDLAHLKDLLGAKKLHPLYIFTGDEVAIMDIYMRKIVEISGLLKQRVNTVADVFSTLKTGSLISQYRVYVIRDDEDFAKQEKVWPELKTGTAQGKNIIILIYDKMDKRSKFYKEHEDILVTFDKLSQEVLTRYILKDSKLSIKSAHKLIEFCDYNYSRILLELDKLQHLAMAKEINIEKAFEYAIDEQFIYAENQDVTFQFIDSMCRRNVNKSMALYDKLKLGDSNMLGIISLLYMNFRSMLLVQSAGRGNIPDRTGLTAWQVKMAQEKGNKYSISELVRSIRKIREAETGIKTGRIPQEIAVDYLIGGIL